VIVELLVIEQVNDGWQMIHQILRHPVGRLEDYAAGPITPQDKRKACYIMETVDIISLMNPEGSDTELDEQHGLTQNFGEYYFLLHFRLLTDYVLCRISRH
jgi:hypothetical protein